MRALIIIAAMCLISSRAFADEPDITKAPSGQYSIVQSAVEQGVKIVLHFRDKSKPDVILKTPPPGIKGYLAKHNFSAELGSLLRSRRSDYFISPDERWIVRDEHLASGCNVLVLYKIMSNGRVQVLLLNQLAFDCVFAGSHRSEADPYGTLALQFVSWEPGLVHLEVFSHPEIPNTYPRIDGRPVTYDLNKHKMIDALTKR